VGVPAHRKKDLSRVGVPAHRKKDLSRVGVSPTVFVCVVCVVCSYLRSSNEFTLALNPYCNGYELNTLVFVK